MPFTKVTLKTAPELKALVRVADPTYKKMCAYVHTSETVTLSGTFWDEGSRSTYHAIELASMRVLPAPQYDPPQFGGPRTSPVVAIPAGVAIVETGLTCGKVSTAHVTFHPSDSVRMIGESVT